MFKRTLTQSDIFLIAANLLPVVGVWFFGWNPKEVFIVYCLETIILGFYNLVKMAFITAVKKTDIWQNNGTQTRVWGYFLACQVSGMSIRSGSSAFFINGRN